MKSFRKRMRNLIERAGGLSKRDDSRDGNEQRSQIAN